ncbi:MAG: VRR-NUC domain-containing protein [Methylobacter sp.]
MTEHDHQVAWFKWFRAQFPGVLAYAIPNGGHRHIAVAAKLKAEGVTPGIPDIFIADGKPGMYIEMKEPKKGSVSKKQKEVIPKLQSAGYTVAVCFGWDEAREAAIEYLTK